MVFIVCVLHEPLNIKGKEGDFSKKRRQLGQNFGHLDCIIYLYILQDLEPRVGASQCCCVPLAESCSDPQANLHPPDHSLIQTL